MRLERRDAGRIRDAIDFGTKVVELVAGMDRTSLAEDARTLFAACYGIQVVGEALWKVSEAVKRERTEIPWPLIESMRHRLVHDYGRTDEAVVHQVATDHLPRLLDQLRAILAEP